MAKEKQLKGIECHQKIPVMYTKRFSLDTFYYWQPKLKFRNSPHSPKVLGSENYFPRFLYFIVR